MSSLTVIQSKITNVDILPRSMPSIDGMSVDKLSDLFISKLFSSDVSYLYGAGDCIKEIKKFDAVAMFSDMKHFMHAYEGDMVVFYSNEIKLKFGGDDLAMDYLHYLQLSYMDMVVMSIFKDMIRRTPSQSECKPFHISDGYNEEEKALLAKILDECHYQSVIWKDTINSPRELSEQGFVYILEDKKNNLVKIGMSKNPKQRIRNIESTSGRSFSKVFISDFIYDYKRVEVLAHDELSDHRRIGEWFCCSYDEALNTVSFIAAQTPKPDDCQIKISSLIKRYNSDITSAFMVNVMEGNADSGLLN